MTRNPGRFSWPSSLSSVTSADRSHHPYWVLPWQIGLFHLLRDKYYQTFRPCLFHLPYILSFPFSLMSVSKMATHASNFPITFYPDSCVFQDLDTKKTIVEDMSMQAFYYLYDIPVPTACQSVASPLQIHCRRHPCLKNLMKLVPNCIIHHFIMWLMLTRLATSCESR